MCCLAGGRYLLRVVSASQGDALTLLDYDEVDELGVVARRMWLDEDAEMGIRLRQQSVVRVHIGLNSR